MSREFTFGPVRCRRCDELLGTDDDGDEVCKRCREEEENQQQCAYCGEYYPYPVAYYHTWAECEQNQREAK